MPPDPSRVLRYRDINPHSIHTVLDRYGLKLSIQDNNQPPRGSFWGDDEAGLVADKVYIRPDTPVHSILHEACHYICMDERRRTNLHTDAGGDYDEENAVCYLQILLADELPEMGQARMFEDMDNWEYGFRLGSAKTWFQDDAEDACDWLRRNELITDKGHPCWNCRA